MAAAWYWAINHANDKGSIVKPTESGRFTDGDGSTQCRKEYGSGDQDTRSGKWILGAADERITNDGPYKHSSVHRTDRGVKHAGGKDARVYLAQLFNFGNPKGGEIDELIVVSGNDDDRTIMYYRNTGDGVTDVGKEIDVHDSCKTRGKGEFLLGLIVLDLALDLFLRARLISLVP